MDRIFLPLFAMRCLQSQPNPKASVASNPIIVNLNPLIQNRYKLWMKCWKELGHSSKI